MKMKLILIFIFSSLMLACSDAHEPAIRIGSSPWPGYEPLYLARDLGYLDQNKVKLFELPSADITLESFRNHSTDMATLTLDGILELLSEGVGMRMILIMDISHGGDVALASPAVKSLADLKGKRIAAANIPLGIYMVSRMLDKAGLERKDVEVFLMAETEHEAFYQQGNADVIVTYDPVKTRLQNVGMKVLFDSADIPNEIFDILVVREDIYLSRRADVCDVVNQWFKTIEYMRQQPDDAARRISQRLGVTVDEYQQMMQGIVIPDKKENASILGGHSPTIVASANRMAKIMQQERMLQNAVEIEPAIDVDFVNCIQ